MKLQRILTPELSDTAMYLIALKPNKNIVSKQNLMWNNSQKQDKRSLQACYPWDSIV